MREIVRVIHGATGHSSKYILVPNPTAPLPRKYQTASLEGRFEVEARNRSLTLIYDMRKEEDLGPLLITQSRVRRQNLSAILDWMAYEHL